jgi:hypothetical protein
MAAGVPFVEMLDEVQPSSAAPCATILPCSSHGEAPQLMNTIFLPDGTGFPIGFVTLIEVGRCEAWATIA